MMNAISIKGIGVGVLTILALSIPIGILFGYFFLTVYGRFAVGVNLSNEAEFQKLIARSIYYPPTIIFGVLSILVTAGIPAYVAAYTAGRAFIFHSMIIGGIVSIMCLVEWDLVVHFPGLYVVIVSFTLVVAYVAGHIRRKQVLAMQDSL